MIDLVEFLIRGEPDEDFGLHVGQYAEALVPAGVACEIPAGFGKTHLDLLVEGVKVSFSPEPVGWQVSIHDAPSRDWASNVVDAVCASLSRVSGRAGKVIPL